MRLVRRPLPYIPSHTYAQRHTSKTKSKAKASLPGLRRTALRRLQRVGCEVGFWHKADIAAYPLDVRSWGRADMCERCRQVHF